MKYILFVLFFPVIIYAQINESNKLPQIIPPSPEASSLAKFTDIPVSHYTGIPSINVPIYEINFDGLKIPIDLSYHARGIKVEEIASRVGIGWALNAGGAITRQIRQLDDFGGNGYLQKNFYKNFETSQQVRDSIFAKATTDEIDLIPDQFIFNFLGYSGKFIFDQDTKQPVLERFDDLKIEKFGDFEDTIYFVLTDKDGFKYYFGNPLTPDVYREAKSKEKGNTAYVTEIGTSTYAASDDRINTWHLVDIESPNGEKIEFNYEVENSIFYRRSYDVKKATGNPRSHFSQIMQEEYQLKEIVFDQGKVKFIKNNSQREDLNEGYTLSSIEIENKFQRIKKYNFNYSYSTSSNINDGNVNYFLFYEIQARKRLFLDSIQIIGKNNIQELYRGFEYTDKNSLPNRFSNSQDFWGYYNGKNNGPFLTQYGYGSQFVDRKVDTIKANIGLIRKMIYPTGGYTAYTFEANQALMPEYFKELYYADPNPVGQNKSVLLSKSIFTLVSSNSQKNTYESTAFDILSTDLGPINVKVNLYGNAAICQLDSQGFQNSSCRYVISIIDSSSGQTVVRNGIPLLLYKSNAPSYNIDIESLKPGKYKIRADVSTGTDSPYDRDNSFLVNLSWSSIINSNQPNLIYSGGNRIKKIENNSLDNGIITKTYEYQNSDGSSSGLVFSLPHYYYNQKIVTLPNGAQVPVMDTFGARPGSPLTNEQGNHVGYSHVNEYINSNSQQGEGGKIEYHFTAFTDGGKFYRFPYTLAVNNEWLRGKPTLIEYYKRNANLTYSIVKKVESTYKYAGTFSHNELTDPYNLRTLLDDIVLNMNFVKNNLKYYRPLITFNRYYFSAQYNASNSYKVYYLTGGVQNLYQQKETLFYDSGTPETTTTYNYDFDKHYQLKGTETVDSNNKVIKSINYYPTDKLNLTGLTQEAEIAVNSLVLKNRFELIQTDVFKDNVLQSKVRTNFKVWSGTTIAVKNVQTSKEDNQALEDRIVYHNYDKKGNPLEVSKKDGTMICYVWGYNQTQPIAKIENATYASINPSLITAAQTASNTGTEASLLAALIALRTALPNAMVTTYTHIPLIGVSTITDPKGDKITYTYDSFGRLQFVKDKDNNILSENEYRYKN